MTVEEKKRELSYEPYSSSKHSGVLSYFNKRFIREGVFHEDIGRSINKAFELRQRGDYREYIDLSYEQVEPFIKEAEVFIETVKNHLNL
ncbi:MAG: HEPN domain-containing protein [Nitrospirae bacterium]|nr:HEPN domain-containing protein [Nitrospirota bacterium]